MNDLDRLKQLTEQRNELDTEINELRRRIQFVIDEVGGDRRLGIQTRNKITPELLDHVIELHAKGGADLVAERFLVSKSQAFRYVKAAKERPET